MDAGAPSVNINYALIVWGQSPLIRRGLSSVEVDGWCIRDLGERSTSWFRLGFA
jgi:hypothetical protein